ncbi:YidC/Oxa1 family membrane protein insertase [Candidatus Saccharibacteria bacterium]|nr:YidC/Oxa1 family membrane protein insertase [Candidatus Saccharibacteria bacterium]
MGLWSTLVVQPIFNLLLAIYGLVGDFGVAIIIFTIIIKFAMWPLMKKQLQHVQLMRKLQPELGEIKKRCKGNRQLETVQMMNLYKKHNVRPFASLLPLLLQIPIFIVLFNVVGSALMNAESVGRYAYEFMYNIPKVEALREEMEENPESFNLGLFGLDLRETALPVEGWESGVLLGLVLGAGVLQFTVMKQQQPDAKKRRKLKDIMKDAAQGKDADQAEVNAIVTGQMAKIMPVITMFIMINLPGALVLYFFTSNLLTVLQQRWVFKEDVAEALDNVADKQVLKELAKAEEGNIIRVKATDKGRKK